MRYCSLVSTRAASTTAQRPDGPVGRDEIVTATLAAAVDLFAQKGPAATSIRDVAAHAGINHGLLHRHFGNKEQLVGAVLNHLGQHLADLIAAGAPGPEIEAAIDRQLRVIARASLDGFPIGELQTRFPNMPLVLDPLRRQHRDELSARLAAAHAIALQLSWRLFENVLRASAGLDDLPGDQLRQSINTEIARITTPH